MPDTSSTSDGTSRSCSVSINSTNFSRNNGSAVILSAVQTTTVQNSTFVSNQIVGTNVISSSGPEGGAILATSCIEIVISNSTFIDNVSLDNGGAISVLNINSGSSSLTVSNSTFQLNKSMLGSGGALCVSGVAKLNVDSSSFTDCSAAIAGGSIFGIGPSTGSAYIRLCSFVGSVVGALPPGGRISTSDSVLGPRDVSTQLQLQGGGGMFISSFELLSVVDCMFTLCRSVRSKGGGLRFRACMRADLKHTSFTHCQAAAAGALFVGSMLQVPRVRVGLQSTVFTNNSASTQLECPASACVELDRTLVGTQGDGGAVSIDGCSLDLYNVNTFESNTASGHGGALFAQRPAESGFILFESDYSELERRFSAPGYAPDQYPIHTSFINNTALASGGAIALSGYMLDLGTPLKEATDAFPYTLFHGNMASTGRHSCWAFFM